ncbi:MAG TPA: hypothetical protein VGG28_13685 [Kofleriaceae bacterium]|jgi:hypothetical protein
MSATKTRIMYIQHGWAPGRIGRVRLSKTGRTLHYREVELVAISSGYKTNHIDVETRGEYWISGPRKDGQDTLYPGVVEIDDDVREEYWRDVRREPAHVRETSFRSRGVHGNHATR